MKKLLFPLLTLFLLLPLLAAPASASGELLELGLYNVESGQYERRTVTALDLSWDGELLEYDVPAFAVDQRTLVPVRLVSEKLDAQVEWVGGNEISIQKGNSQILLTTGSSMALVDGVETELPNGVSVALAKVYHEDGSVTERTMVPLRFVSEQLGAFVDWDQDSLTAIVETRQNVPPRYDVLGIREDPESRSLLIPTSDMPDCNILDFGDRLVLDFLDANLASGRPGTLELDHPVVASVRWSQYDQHYKDHPHVVRVVLDLKEGCAYGQQIFAAVRDNGLLATLEGEAAPLPEPEPGLPPEDRPVTRYSDFTVLLDAGHGGTDPGAVYPDADGFDVYEKDINLAVTLKVRDLLEAQGVNILMMREDDVTLPTRLRPDMANEAGPDLYVSIHSNANDNPTLTGIFTYYFKDSALGKSLAQSVQSGAVAATGAADKGLMTSSTLLVLRFTSMPSCLIEMGFMSTPEELALLTNEGYQDLLAAGIAQGILHQLDQRIANPQDFAAAVEPPVEDAA